MLAGDFSFTTGKNVKAGNRVTGMKLLFYFFIDNNNICDYTISRKNVYNVEIRKILQCGCIFLFNLMSYINRWNDEGIASLFYFL